MTNGIQISAKAWTLYERHLSEAMALLSRPSALFKAFRLIDRTAKSLTMSNKRRARKQRVESSPSISQPILTHTCQTAMAWFFYLQTRRRESLSMNTRDCKGIHRKGCLSQPLHLQLPKKNGMTAGHPVPFLF